MLILFSHVTGHKTTKMIAPLPWWWPCWQPQCRRCSECPRCCWCTWSWGPAHRSTSSSPAQHSKQTITSNFPHHGCLKQHAHLPTNWKISTCIAIVSWKWAPKKLMKVLQTLLGVCGGETTNIGEGDGGRVRPMTPQATAAHGFQKWTSWACENENLGQVVLSWCCIQITRDTTGTLSLVFQTVKTQVTNESSLCRPPHSTHQHTEPGNRKD